MKKEEIKDYIDKNLENLPLLFKDLVFKDSLELKDNLKVVKSEKFSEENYMIYKFYKPITRF